MTVWLRYNYGFLSRFFGRFLQFFKKVYKAQKFTIARFNALIMDVLILDGQMCGIIRDRSASPKQICHVCFEHLLSNLC